MVSIAMEKRNRLHRERQKYLLELKCANITQTDIALEAGVSSSMVSQYFAAVSNSVAVDKIVKNKINKIKSGSISNNTSA